MHHNLAAVAIVCDASRAVRESGRIAAQGEGGQKARVICEIRGVKAVGWRKFYQSQITRLRQQPAGCTPIKISSSPVPQRLAGPSLPTSSRVSPIALRRSSPIHSVASKSRVFQSTEPNPFLSIVPSARYISLSRGQAPAAHLEGKSRVRDCDRYQSRAYPLRALAPATSLPKHPQLRRITTTTNTLIQKALPAAPSSATTSSTSPSSSRRILHPSPTVPLCSE